MKKIFTKLFILLLFLALQFQANSQIVLSGNIGLSQRLDRNLNGTNFGIECAFLSKGTIRMGVLSNLTLLTGFGKFENPRDLNYNIYNSQTQNPFPSGESHDIAGNGVFATRAKPESNNMYSTAFFITKYSDTDQSGFRGTFSIGLGYVVLAEVEHLLEVDAITQGENNTVISGDEALIVMYRYERFLDLPIGLSGGYSWAITPNFSINALAGFSWMPFSNISTASINVSVDIGS